MPIGSPPVIKLRQSVFNALSPLSYDSANEAFDDSGTLYYLYVEDDSGDAAWIEGTGSQGTDNPKAFVPNSTYDIISGGTYNATKNAVSYNGKLYYFRLERVSGTQMIMPFFN